MSFPLEPRHPYPIAQQNVVQKTMDTTERALSLLPVLDAVQLRTPFKEPLIRNAVIACNHSKVSW